MSNAVVEALASALEAPEEQDRWDRAEALAREAQAPDPVLDAYREALGKVSAPGLVASLGQRAVAFHDEWSDSADELVALLDRVLIAAPDTGWAFERMSMVLTNRENWDQLLDVYDRALSAAEDDARRIALLDEAAGVAKDFAGQNERAIGYLAQLLTLDPSDAQVARSLERLYERHERHRELIALWTLRLPFLPEDQCRATRLRVAHTWLDPLREPREALEVAEALQGDRDPDALALLEKIAALGEPQDTARRAIAHLSRRYAALGRDEDVLRTLALHLALAEDDPKRAEVHRELAARLDRAGRGADAVEHYAALVVLEPEEPSHRTRLAELAEVTRKHDRLADALARAAEVTRDGSLRTAFLVDAAEVRCDVLQDPSGAIALFARVLAFPDGEVPPAVLLKVARRLDPLYGDASLGAEQLAVLERLAALEPDPSARRDTLGRAARLADARGETDRALAAWRLRRQDDPSDAEALDAIVELLARDRRWDALIDALRERSERATDTASRRRDLVRVARVQAEERQSPADAIETWTRVADAFGEDPEVVDALAALYHATERFPELLALLDRAADAERDSARRARLLRAAGDVHRTRSQSPAEALERYRRALESDPREPGAREGLEALLSDESSRPEAVALLARAFAATDDWSRTLWVLEHRLQVAPSPRARAELLREAARLREARAEDLAGALGDLCRALPCCDNDQSAEVERELQRLAAATGGWSDAVQAYADARQGALEPSRQAHLAFEQGTLLEKQLDALPLALEAYQAVSGLEPSNLGASLAVVRVAARTRAFEALARGLVSSARHRGALDPALVRVVEDVLGDERATWDQAPSALERAVAALPAGTPPAVLRELETRVALWHRDHRHAPEDAEQALRRAAAHDRTDAGTLGLLAQLQRRAPGTDLVDTLVALSEAAPPGLEALHEAAQVALSLEAEGTRARDILSQFLERASAHWTAARDAGDLGAADAARAEASWGLRALVDAWSADGEHGKAVGLLVAGARMPFAPEASRDLRFEAAERSARDLRDNDRAIALLCGILEEAPADFRALERLAGLYEATGRMDELVALRRAELGLADTQARRLTLRLELARVHEARGDTEGRAQALRENLQDLPGHAPSVEALGALLERGGRTEELVALLCAQARETEGREGPQAAALWARAAELSEARLGDAARAVACHERVVALVSSSSSLDALARLQAARGDHGATVRYLEQRLELVTGPEHGATVVRLARAHQAQGAPERARQCLEAGLSRDPSCLEVRALLAEVYRKAEAWESLATLLLEGPEGAGAGRVAALREAAEVLTRRVGAPERAIPVLAQAQALVPEDRGVKLSLADALRAAGRGDEARALLGALVESYGRQRPAERAVAHYLLASIARARGDVNETLAQLDLAAGMDMAHAGAYRMLGEVAREAGQLDRAEKAYRALLLVVRRHPPGDAQDPQAVGTSEVQFALHTIAQAQGREERAREVLESAFETAARSEVEARRLERVLRAEGRTELLLRALQGRLALEGDDPRSAGTHADIAAVLDVLGRPEEALEARLRALTLAPGDANLQGATRAAARVQGASGRYAEALRRSAESAAEAHDTALACALWLRLATALEEDLGDAPGAARCLERAEDTHARAVEVWQALDRVYGVIGDPAGQARVLRRLVDAESGDGAGGSPTEVLFRLSALELASDDENARNEGLSWLSWALERDPQHQRAAELLRRAAEAHPTHEGLLVQYDHVARATDNPEVLLDALVRRAGRDDVPADALREGAELASSLGDLEHGEMFLRRAVEVARARGTLPSAVWALVALAERRQAAGDVAGAVQWMRDAAEVADPTEAFHLGLQVAALAAGSLGDLQLAADTYERLLARDPTDRNVWEPLLDVYRLLNDDAKLEALISRTVDSVFDREGRNRLRMERARILLGDRARADDAASTLRDVLDEDPDDATAATALADLYDREGRGDDLAELLTRQFDTARDRRDGATVKALAARLVALLGPARREAARDHLRAALELVPEDRELLRSLVALSPAEEDLHDQAALQERLLRCEEGEAAAHLGDSLATLYESLGDDAGAERALELGFRAQPTSARLLLRLEARYLGRDDWAKLAAVRELDARHRAGREARCAGFREAASLFRDRLRDPAGAARLFREARAAMPEDPTVLAEHARALASAGEHAAAVEEVTSAIEAPGVDPSLWIDLFRLRAELRMAGGDDSGAVADLEAAYARGGKALARELASGLDRLRAQAARVEDRAAERASTLRLVEVLPDAGNADMAHALLTEWIGRSPEDRDALERLAALDVSAGRWDQAAKVLHRLVAASEGDARVEAALRLADACDKAGRPADAREGLERAYAGARAHEGLRGKLRALYQAAEAHRELAGLTLDDAAHARDDAARFEKLRKAGELYLDLVGDAEKAIAALEGALKLKPLDHESTVLLADAYTMAERLEDASKLLNEGIAGHKGRRSRELAVLQHRMGRLAYAAGDHQVEMAWLNVALDTDMQNGQVAAELADVAMELTQYEIALKALRAITMMKTPAPMPRAVAFLRQGQIAQTQGDPKKATFFARKALAEDGALAEAQQFLDSLSAGE
ncbi:MAG: tetratricopeptide repeat protein [Deltaproteobacteria bacterium]|nr:tetratricopeptide repeat protein [Deltaproteobacteria bacterium]